MSLNVWLKIGSFFMTTRHFGVYIRMMQHMMVVILNFLIIMGAWILCAALIFTALFYQLNDQFKDYFISI